LVGGSTKRWKAVNLSQPTAGVERRRRASKSEIVAGEWAVNCGFAAANAADAAGLMAAMADADSVKCRILMMAM